jgi:hypothetical protein
VDENMIKSNYVLRFNGVYKKIECTELIILIVKKCL